MRYTKKRIYDLLPAVYRQRDIDSGSPLKALIDVIAEQIKIVENDIAGLYENWFIETCDEWVVPYIADLIKARVLYPVSNSTYSQRAWVANTIGYRRRKGTLAVLEQIARDVTGWNAKAVEFFELLVTTQYLNHLRLKSLATPDLRDMENLDRLTTPFNTISHTLDVRHIDKQRGYFNIPNIGIFVWRLQSFPVYNAPALDHGDGKFTFNRLGYDIPLFNHPKLEKGPAGVAEEINIAAPIRMLAMYKSLTDYYYGEAIENNSEHRSIQIRTDNSIRNAKDIIVCDLTEWMHRPPPKKIAIDPVLGRILFPAGEFPISVHTTHYYGFSGKVGGGFYVRPIFASDIIDIQNVYKISKNKISGSEDGDDDENNPLVSASVNSINEAITRWIDDGKKSAIFEILDSEFYDEGTLLLDIPSETKVIIRAGRERQPILRLKGPMRIEGGGKGSSIILDGLLFDISQKDNDEDHDDGDDGDSDLDKESNSNNNNLLTILRGDLSRLMLRHCTLVPGRNKDANYDSKFLCTWESLLDSSPNNLNHANRLKKFLTENFEIFQWVNNADVKLEFLSDKVVKISSPTNPNSFLTITRNSKNTIAVLRLNTTDEAIFDSNTTTYTDPQHPVIYEFSVKEEDGKINIYNPKMSLLIAGGADGTENEHNNNKNNDNLVVTIENTICGKILTAQSEARVQVSKSIIDGKGSKNAITCYISRIENSTIFGSANIVILELASNVIFTGTLMVKRRQTGCVRFCYVSPGSFTPRRYHCQPEYFNPTAHSLANESDDTYLNIFPRFTSTSYGEPGYAQLHKNTSKIIFEGADNGSEIGVFNNLFLAQRINNLKLSLDEYLRFGLEAGIFLVD